MKEIFKFFFTKKENHSPFIKGKSSIAAKKWLNGFALVLLLSNTSAFAQTGQMEGYLGSRNTNSGPSNTGSDTAAVLGYNTGSSAVFSPSGISYSIAFSNQQYTTAPTSGLSAGAATSGGTTASAESYWVPQGNISGTSAGLNANFTAHPSGPAGTGISTTQNYAFSVFSRASYLAGQAVVGRRYYGDITITFSQPVSNPVIHITEMGGGYASGATSNYTAFFSELDIQTPGITQVRLSGTTAFSVSSTSIFSSAAPAGGTNTLSDYLGNGSKASSGSVLLQTTTPVTSVTFQVWLRSFGGATSNPGFPPATTTTGDRFNLGVSLAADSFAIPADLSIIQTGPANVAAGTATSYTLHITNNGPSAVVNAVVKDSAVANFVAGTVTCTAGSGDGGAATCPVSPTISSLQSTGLIIPYIPPYGTITLIVNGTSGVSGSIINNKASVATPAGTPDPTPGNNVSTVVTTIGNCTGTQTVYTLNAASTLAGAGAVGANGGSFNLVYALSSGTAIPGLGSSFTIPVTYSDFNNTVSAANHTWSQYNTITGDFTGTGATTVFSIVPNVNSFATTLPSPNNATPAAGGNADQIFTNSLANGTLKPLGIFDLNIGAIPALPAGVKTLSQSLDIFSSNNGDGTRAFWLKSLDQPLVNSLATAATTPLVVGHGNTYKFVYSAYSPDGAMVSNGGNRGLLIGYGSITFCTESLVQLSGNVFNDGNGLNDVGGGIVNTSGAGALNPLNGTSLDGSPLFATLLNAGDAAVTTVPLTATGTYLFPAVTPGTYSIVLSTSPTGSTTPSLPTGWAFVGENTGTGIGNDGIANGILTNIVVGAANISNANFGINKVPVANNVTGTSQTNPVGTNTVVVPALNGTDPENGIIGTGNQMTIVTLPANAILYYDNDGDGAEPGEEIIAGQSIATYDPAKLLADPDNGTLTVSFTYTVTDAAGAQDPTPASVTLPFTAPVTISGNVWNDANGDILTNGTEAGVDAGSATLTAYLVGGSDQVAASADIAADGTYSFSTVSPSTLYTVVLSNTSGVVPGSPAPAVSLPVNWVNTGEAFGVNNLAGTGTEILTPGIISVLTPATGSVTGIDFGIDQMPDATSSATPIAQPALNDIITLNGGTNPPVPTGIDPEDGALGSGNTIVITTLPVNANLLYNGIIATAGQIIPGFDPALLQIQLTPATIGATGTSFGFAYRDAAGVVDPSPALYQLTWQQPLPVTLMNFTVVRKGDDALLNWTTITEHNSSRFEVQHSIDGKQWNILQHIKARGESQEAVFYEYLHTHPQIGENLYRLNMIDMDGKSMYSPIQRLRFDDDGLSADIYPNPVYGMLYLKGRGIENIREVTIMNINGQTVLKSDYVANRGIDVAKLAAGLYIVKLTGANGVFSMHKVLVVH